MSEHAPLASSSSSPYGATQNEENVPLAREGAVISLNDALSDIGVGWYQWLLVLSLAGLLVQDGSEMVILTSVVNALQEEWDLSKSMRSFLVSVPFTGVLFGSLSTGFVADKVGRKPVVIFAYVLMLGAGIGSAFSPNVGVMIILRFLIGIAYGLAIVSSLTLLTESVPLRLRNEVSLVSMACFVVGEVFGAALIWLWMPDLKLSADKNNWRLVTGWGCSISVALFPLTLLTLHESPHFLMVQGRTQDLAGLLRRIQSLNGREVKSYNISPPTEQDLADQRRSPLETLKKLYGYIMTTPMLGRTTAIGSYHCFIGNFKFIGLAYAMPILLKELSEQSPDKGKGDISDGAKLFIVTCATSPSILLSILLSCSSLGHRETMAITAFSAAVFVLGMIPMDAGYTTIGLISICVAQVIGPAFLSLAYVYLPACYPTTCRSAATGRLGAIVAPLCFEGLTQFTMFNRKNAVTPFLITLAALQVLAGVLCFFLPLESKSRNLDSFALGDQEGEEEGERRAG